MPCHAVSVPEVPIGPEDALPPPTSSAPGFRVRAYNPTDTKILNACAVQVRSLSVLEGIALASDPNYKVLGAAYPWIARRLLTDRSPELRVRLTPSLGPEP